MIFLIGRHGAGKSSIASCMVESGYQYVSIGMLRRLARSRQFPADVPAVLMTALARARPAPLPLPLTQKFIAFAASKPHVIVDGLPASFEHISLIPPDALIAYVWAGKSARHDRLMERAKNTLRQWMPGRISVREEALASVVRGLRKKQGVLFINNSRPNANAPRELARQLILMEQNQEFQMPYSINESLLLR
jgi:cytidylate kinase